MPRGTLRANTKKEKVVIVILAIFILFLFRGVWGLYVKHTIATNELNLVENQLSQVQKRYTDLSEEVKSLQTERGVEQSIREKFHVAKPGEKTVILIAPEKGTKEVENTSVWSKIKSFFIR